MEPEQVEIDRWETCLKKLALHLQLVAREIYQCKQSHRVFRGTASCPSDNGTHIVRYVHHHFRMIPKFWFIVIIQESFLGMPIVNVI